MNVDELLDVMGEIDDSYLTEAKEQPNRRKIKWMAIGSLAACFFFVLFMPYGFLHRIVTMNQTEVDYTSKDYTKFQVYYADGDALSHFTYEIHGGYDEMFFAWKNQNGISGDVLLKKMNLQPNVAAEDSIPMDSPGREYILRVEISSAFGEYMEKDNAQLLLESLKKTVASYTGTKISDIELILVE